MNGSYQTYVNTLPSYLNAAPPVYGRCLESNFDERPRYPILYAPGTENQVRCFKDQTPQLLFGRTVSTVDNDIANSTRMSPIDNFTFIYAWNE